MELAKKTSLLICAVLACGVLTGCQMGRGMYVPGMRDHYKFEELAKHHPTTRIGTLANSAMVALTWDSSKLGKHGYTPNGSERNGVVYTCRGGHLDLAHVRNVADWTGYLASKSYWNINNDNETFSFKLGEDAMCFVDIKYPDNWKDISDEDKDTAARDISFGLGQYLAHQFSVWHEIITWFGYKSVGVYPEFKSAFSWEDTYSDLLGSRIGYAALRNNEYCFSDAVTLALDQEMANLGIQHRNVARVAAQKMRSKKCKDLVPTANIETRNFDVGVDDGNITPWIVPSVGSCQQEPPQAYPVPDLKFLDKYGFSIKFQIEPKVWEKTKIMKVVYGDDYKKTNLIEPSEHFGKVMTYIEQQAAKKFGVLNSHKNTTN